MGIVAERLSCRCGDIMENHFVCISWFDAEGVFYKINNVPVIRCNKFGCTEEYKSADVQINVSILADDMRNGLLPSEIEYEERF